LRDEMGVMAYDLGYLDSATRAVVEAQCYLVNLEVYYLYTRSTGMGRIPSLDLAPVLRAYGCNSKDIRAAQAVLDRGARVVAKGGIGTAAAQTVGRFRTGCAGAGLFMGLAIVLRLLGLTQLQKRSVHEADRVRCIACGRCFPACPVNAKKSVPPAA
jgi:NAD-dependent dihydropyrimidine dehydrogenase PreA subunit